MTVQNAMYVGFQMALVFVLLCAGLAGMVQLALDHPKIFFVAVVAEIFALATAGAYFGGK